uniref:Uncharacterized protein n=1 Tax=Trichogramma kaykai TaxID=54128 RepID=A0ABD2WUU2_9HYME
MACSPQLPQSLAIRNSQYFPQPQLPLKDDNLKFCSVITHAGANICKSISAFLKSVPDAEPEKYSKLKEHLISKYSQTVHQKINQLLAGVSLEGKNPSDLFNDMSSLAQGHVPVETVLLLWYRHLPTELVMVLGEAVTSSNAPQASAKVDRLFEHIKHKFTPQICAVAPPNSSQGVDDALVNRISELVISAVSSKFESNSMRDRSVEKQEKPQSPRSSSKPRHGENKDLCLYHHRLIDNVTKLSAKGQLAPANLTGVSVLDPLHPLAHLLSRYPQAIRPTTPNSDHVTAISHSLQTSGEPIAQKARRLTPEKLKALRFQFKSNGLLERWNRDFKRALMCFESDEGWTKILPLVMLGLRTRVRSDINSSPAEMVFGSTLRLPGEFFSDHDQEPDLHYFTSEFRSFMKAVRPVPVDPHDKSKPFVHKNLEFCSRVFVRANPIKKALDPPYLGPYQVHLRPSKYFYIIKITNKTVLEELKTVSTGQLKPAFGTFYDAQNPIKSSPDSNQNQTVKFDTRDSDLCDNFDHEEVVPTIKPSSDKALRTGDNVASKQLCKRSFSQSESKSMKPKKKVKFHDDHAYSVANKSSSKKK